MLLGVGLVSLVSLVPLHNQESQAVSNEQSDDRSTPSAHATWICHVARHIQQYWPRRHYFSNCRISGTLTALHLMECQLFIPDRPVTVRISSRCSTNCMAALYLNMLVFIHAGIYNNICQDITSARIVESLRVGSRHLSASGQVAPINALFEGTPWT